MILWKIVCRLFLVFAGLTLGSSLAFADPDLVVKSVTLSTNTPQQGQRISASVTVRNSGTKDVKSSRNLTRYYIAAYICSNAVSDVSNCVSGSGIGSGYIYIGRSSHKVGTDRTTTLYFTIPNSTAIGTAKLVFFVDSTKVIKESNENNNTKDVAVTISAKKPELYISYLYLGSSVEQGQKITVSWFVANAGLQNAGTFKVGFYYSANSTIDPSTDTLLKTVTISSLSSGRSTGNYNESVTLPVGTALGAGYIGVYVDKDSQVSESNETNNAKAFAITVKTPTTDLQPIYFYRTSYYLGGAGTQASVTYYVRNNGSKAAGQFKVRLYYNRNRTSLSGAVILRTDTINGLAGSTTTSKYTRSFNLPNVVSFGRGYFWIEVDSGKAISESNENNNLAYNEIYINARADLTVHALSVTSTTVPQGSQVTLKYRLYNKGLARTGQALAVKAYLSTNSTIQTGDTFLKNLANLAVINAKTLSPLSPNLITAQVTIPANTPPGKYYVGLFVDANLSWTESNENNNGLGKEIRVVSAIDLRADLVKYWTTGFVKIGQTSSFDIKFTNNGKNVIQNVQLRLVYSKDQTIDSNDTLLKTLDLTGLNLQPGAAYTNRQPVAIPNTIASGSGYIGLIVDSNNAIAENNENNNTKVSLVTVFGQDKDKDGVYYAPGCPSAINPCDCDDSLASVKPGAKEICDGKDNDCDGSVDEEHPNKGKTCTVGVGACQSVGQYICKSDGSGTVCNVSPKSPTTEVCNGKDDDCDGQIDEALTRSCYDGTAGTAGVGVCQKGTQTCSSGQWSQCAGQIQPTPEKCNNKDDDCDGQTDEGCNCTDGTTQVCGTNTGECKSGTQTCANGNWGTCVGEVKASAEICDGKDNDCDGQVDEEFGTLGQSCMVGKGLCANKGKVVCKSDKSDVTCSAKPGTPSREVCDGKDNDCDGDTDEGCNCKKGDTQSCSSDVGECKKGTQTCDINGKWGNCSGVTPTKDLCDGKDNDCDGKVDEDFANLGKACDVGKGECLKSGSYVCKKDGSGTQCSAVPSVPTKELCDGKDNDCDGSVDEDFPNKGKSCSEGKGTCLNKGTFVCKSDKSGVSCSAKAGAPQKEDCDGLDNDCDGQVDENLTQTCYDGPAGTAGKGECRKGLQTCAAGKWGACKGEVKPADDLCDGKDNDCDGQTDEGCSCTAGDTRDCGSDKGECKKGTQTCDSKGNWGSCANEVKAKTELCNGKDDDCDGQTDEDFPNVGKSCSVDQGACQGKGKIVCRTDGLSDRCDAVAGKPTDEICDGKDNDCDGQTDEDFGSLGKECSAGVGACENTGKFVCDTGSGKVVCSVKASEPTNEICDGKDNDCDGQVDEDDVCQEPVSDGGPGDGDPGDGDTCGGCPDGEFCRDGSCTEICGCKQCDADELCIDGRCEENPCLNMKCGAGKVCVPHLKACADDPCDSLQCPDGTTCKVGQCVKNNCSKEPDQEPADGGTTDSSEPTKEVTPEPKPEPRPELGETVNWDRAARYDFKIDIPVPVAPDGCGCSTQSGGSGIGLTVFLLMIAFLARRRRRR
jgi:MYXO-CTERM domain-containing protein